MCNKKMILSRLNLLIKVNNKTKKEIATDFHCDTTTITKHFNGSRNITTDYLIKYAKYFNVSADYLLGLSDVPANTNLTDENVRLIIKNYTGLSDDSIHYFFNTKDEKSKISHLINYISSTDEGRILIDNLLSKYG